MRLQRTFKVKHNLRRGFSALVAADDAEGAIAAALGYWNTPDPDDAYSPALLKPTAFGIDSVKRGPDVLVGDPFMEELWRELNEHEWNSDLWDVVSAIVVSAVGRPLDSPDEDEDTRTEAERLRDAADHEEGVAR